MDEMNDITALAGVRDVAVGPTARRHPVRSDRKEHYALEPGDYLLNERKVCRILDCSHATFWRIVQRGELTVIRVSERLVRVRAASVRRLMNGNGPTA